jgi:hypothetical protein
MQTLKRNAERNVTRENGREVSQSTGPLDKHDKWKNSTVSTKDLIKILQKPADFHNPLEVRTAGVGTTKVGMENERFIKSTFGNPITDDSAELPLFADIENYLKTQDALSAQKKAASKQVSLDEDEEDIYSMKMEGGKAYYEEQHTTKRFHNNNGGGHRNPNKRINNSNRSPSADNIGFKLKTPQDHKIMERIKELTRTGLVGRKSTEELTRKGLVGKKEKVL